MDLQKRNNLISAILIVVIIALSVWLYQSITGPYQKVLERKAQTQMVRTRMSNVRDVLIKYKNKHGQFPPNLDSLVVFLKTDSAMVAKGAKEFTKVIGNYNPDSLIYSPLPPHPKFEYTRNDTIRPELYLLVDPSDTTQKIGSLTRTTLLNAGSWE